MKLIGVKLYLILTDMKLKSVPRIAAIASLFVVIQSFESHACVEPAPTVIVTCHYDSITFTDIALKVSNFNLFGGSPNEWCSCAITNYTNVFSNITYVAFVDSGTTVPVAGFLPWNGNAAAGVAWNSVLAGNWNGFVAEVAASGLLAGTPIELIVRASLPLGYTYIVLDSSIALSSIGTDQWIDTGDSLGNMHQSIVSVTSGGTITFDNQPQSFFTALDASILNVGIFEQHAPLVGLAVLPNPSDGRFKVMAESDAFDRIDIYDLIGNQIASIAKSSEYDLSEFPDGLYLIRLVNDAGEPIATQKFLKQN